MLRPIGRDMRKKVVIAIAMIVRRCLIWGFRMKCKCGRPGHRLPGGFVVCEKCFPKAVAAFNEWLEEEE